MAMVAAGAWMMHRGMRVAVAAIMGAILLAVAWASLHATTAPASTASMAHRGKFTDRVPVAPVP